MWVTAGLPLHDIAGPAKASSVHYWFSKSCESEKIARARIITQSVTIETHLYNMYA